MINRWLLIGLGVCLLGLAGAGYALKVQFERNGALETKLQQGRDELTRANDAIALQKRAAGLWKDMSERATGALADERKRTADLEKQRNEAQRLRADADAKLADYLKEIQNDPMHCDNQPVPVAVDIWMRELLSPDVSGGTDHR